MESQNLTFRQIGIIRTRFAQQEGTPIQASMNFFPSISTAFSTSRGSAICT